jgi:hypothetical protein
VERDVLPLEADEMVRMEAMPRPRSRFDAPMMNSPVGTRWGDQFRSGYHEESTMVSSFYTCRNYSSLVALWKSISKAEDGPARRALEFAFTAGLFTSSKMVRCRPRRDGRSNTPGTLYLPPLFLEQNVFRVWERRLSKVSRLKKRLDTATSQTRIGNPEKGLQSASTVEVGDARNISRIKSESVDFVVTDPPFGDSLQYAELNFIAESFLQSFTDSSREIVVNKTRSFTERDYLNSMEGSFSEMFRVLKKGRYMCVLFNNTSPIIWFGIKRSLLINGFSIQSVSGIVKGHGSWNQTVHSGFTSRFDPVLHCIKPVSIAGGPPDLKYLSTEASEQLAIELALRKLSELEDQEGTTYKNTLPYVHSLVIREMLASREICLPPSPRRLLELLDNKVDVERKRDGMIQLR